MERNKIAMNKDYLLFSGEPDLGKLNRPALCVTPYDMLEEPEGGGCLRSCSISLSST